MDLLTQIIGTSAAIVGMLLMLPQVIKTIKTKKVNDLSLIMLILYFLNGLLWTAYGILLSSWPLIVCNVFAFTISVVQLVLFWKYRTKKKS